jgi:hypothetical protein
MDRILLFALVVIILLIPFTLGSLYISIRLYMIGEYSEEIVSDVQIIESKSEAFPEAGSMIYSVVRLQNYSVPFQSQHTDLQPGQQLTLLYSEQLHAGVLLPNGTDLINVLFENVGFGGVIQVYVLFLASFIAIPVRVVRFFRYLFLKMKSWLKENLPNEIKGIRALVIISDFVSQLSAVGVGITLISVIIVLLMKGVLLVEDTGQTSTTIMLLATGLFIFGPIPERIVDFILKLRNEELWRELVITLRNLLASLAGMVIIYKLFQFLLLEDFTNFSSLGKLLYEFFSFLVN